VQDKATMEMESMEDGFVAKLLKTEGAQNIVVGEPVLIMVEDAALVPRFASYTAAAAAPAAAPAAAAAVPTTAASSPSSGVQAAPPVPAVVPARPPPVSSHVQQPARVPAGQRVFASPLARKLAADAGVAIEGISGTGPSGRIIRADVEEALARGTASAASASAGAAVPAGAAPSPLEVFFPDYQDVSLSNIKRVTAKRLTESKQTVPHFYLSVDVRMDALLAARQHMNDSLAAQGKGAAPAAVTKLSVNDWIIKAAAVACVRVPEVNSSWMGDRIRRYNAVDVSVAVQTDAGLMVPIVRNAHAKGLTAIGSDVRALAQKAREGKLAVEDMTGGTFTVSNLGMLGVKSFAAIVNPPQAGILAVGATRPEVRSVAGAKGQWEQVQVMTVTLSCDHRVVDGAVGAQWMAQFKQLVEEPMSMLL
jgi:pyruvate dehydrogenase E2 component (dihydrolipoamide acetyltransferase)